MRAISFLLAIFGLAAFANAGSGSGSASDSAEYVNVDYTGFEKMYVSFASQMAIVFNNTAYDIQLKINEFNSMPGIQPILALSTLYGQYIPPYSVCRYQTHRLVQKMPKLIVPANPNAVTFLFTQDQINTFEAAWAAIEVSNIIAIEGIVNRMNGLETMLYNPNFKFNDKYFVVPSSVASDYYSTFPNWVSGNGGIGSAFQSIIDLGLTSLNAQQNNPYAQYVLTTLFQFFEQNLSIHQKISSAINDAPTVSSSQYSVNIENEVTSIISKANTISNQFSKLANICLQMENAIVNPPPISSNESS